MHRAIVEPARRLRHFWSGAGAPRKDARSGETPSLSVPVRWLRHFWSTRRQSTLPSSIFEVAVTIVVALFTALFALVRFLRGLRKGRIDKFYSAALAIRAKLPHEQSAQRRAMYTSELRALRDEAFASLISEKLAADESFRILQALIYDVIRESESGLALPATEPLGNDTP